MKRALSYFIGIAASLVLILSVFMICLDVTATNWDFYVAEYNKLAQPSNIGISEDELMRVTKKLVGYMRGQEEDIAIKAKIMGKSREVFAKRDRDHMVDVRNLYVFWLWFSRAGCAFALLSGGVVAVVMRREAPKVLSRSFLWGSGIFALIGAALGAWIAVDFNSFWTAFHHLFFTNDLWQLDPATSILIQMVPEQFFFDICVRILSTFAAVMSVLLALSAANIIYRSWRRKELLAIREKEELAKQNYAEEVIEKYALHPPLKSARELVYGEDDFYDDSIAEDDGDGDPPDGEGGAFGAEDGIGGEEQEDGIDGEDELEDEPADERL